MEWVKEIYRGLGRKSSAWSTECESVTLTFYPDFTFEINHNTYKGFDGSLSLGYGSDSNDTSTIYEGKYFRKKGQFHLLCETEKFSFRSRGGPEF